LADGTALTTTYENSVFSIAPDSGNATFKGTVTATTYYGALETKTTGTDAARPVWFSYYASSAVQDGVLEKDTDFTYNPSTNVLVVGKLTITGGTTNSTIASSGILDIANATNALNISTTTGAMTLSTINGAWEAESTGTGTVKLTGNSGAMTISTVDGNMTVGPTGTGTLTVGTNGGALTIQTTGGDMSLLANNGTISVTSGTNKSISVTSGGTMSLYSGTTMSISSTTSTSISSTTTMSLAATTTMTISSGSGQTTRINSGSTLYLDTPTSASVVFRNVTTEYARFNINGNLQIDSDNAAGTQNTHKLYVKGASAFEGKIAFATAGSNSITEQAYMQYNTTDKSIDFIFT